MAKFSSPTQSYFTPFRKSIHHLDLPDQFNYPFYYTPHSIAIQAAEELQDYLTNQTELDHNFGLDTNKDGIEIGKMFGVLVVRDYKGNIGYLSAYSGKLSGNNASQVFVPTVFDSVLHEAFLNEGMLYLNELNKEIGFLESDKNYLSIKDRYERLKTEVDDIITIERAKLIEARKNRKLKRQSYDGLSEELKKKKLDALNMESIQQKFFLKEYEVYLFDKLASLKSQLGLYEEKIESLKIGRKNYSFDLQNKIFDHYHFLNKEGEVKSLINIFKDIHGLSPPAGTGECAAPKLLQYAYVNQLHPIALAEFWWGKSPSSEIRKHTNYYPSCRGKCEPILGHMLKGINVEPNPLLDSLALDKKIEIVYEDDDLLVINKPSELLSVPGKVIEDAVSTRMKKRYPHATGPLVVHRLDMSTSGLMLIAKSKEIHKSLQRGFIKRQTRKRYIAVLEGIISEENRNFENQTIDLPLRLDIEDRPRQLVCYEHGKSARTHWKIISENNNRTRIYFYPITGRTHQLRVHSAHQLGLDTPIVGDDLYGTRDERLMLHAEQIEFVHPRTQKSIKVQVDPPF